MAALINCASPKEIVFTSGGTESVNHAIKGVVLANAKKGNHIITSNVEHNAVIRSLKRLKGQGFKVTSLDVDAQGRVDPQAVADAITDKTILVSIMHSNNETGTIQPIAEIAKITRAHNIILHTDAVDSVGVVPMDVQKLGIDLMSFGVQHLLRPHGRGRPVYPARNHDLAPDRRRRPGTQQTGRHRKPDRNHRHGRGRRGRPAGYGRCDWLTWKS